MSCPLVTFIVPLKSPDVSADWSVVSRLANNTIKSFLNQSNGDWQCILVCNEPPEDVAHDRRLRIFQHSFPIPGTPEEQMMDKGLKKLFALAQLRKSGGRYAMLVDADDLVHRDIVQYVQKNSRIHGWTVSSGYRRFGKWPFLEIIENFDQKCGSSVILALNEAELPDVYDPSMMPHPHPLMQPHGTIRGVFEDQRRPLGRLPFRAVVQNCATGENYVNTSLPRIGLRNMFWVLSRMRLSTPRLRREFALI